MSFLKAFFSSCLGALVALVIFCLSIVLFFVLSSADTFVVKPKSVLQLKLMLPVAELVPEDGLADLLPELADNRTGLLALKEVIKHAGSDANIEGIYLNVTQVPAGFSSLTEIRNSILDFRKTGKWVVAYSDNFSEGAYYLASTANEVYLNPHGMVEFNGLSVEIMHYKKLFDKLEIKPEVFKVGDFKSAVEPYLLERMSDQNRLQLTSVIQSIHEEMLGSVAESRNVPLEKLRAAADQMLVRNAAQAVQVGLVDSLFYDDQVKDVMRKKLGLLKDKRISMVSYSDYKGVILPSETDSADQIAVIVADGNILPGSSNPGIVGSATIMQEVRRARLSDRVKAIVVRINSPGGSFQAADQMWRELRLAAQEKPVIASMSDYAASGGYYLAMACDTIVAQPTTITGSIGIFTVLFDLSGMLENKIGITSDVVKTGEVGDMVSFTRPLSTLEKEIWQRQTDEIYDVFVSKAADGRGMSIDELKKVASGRVWTGAQAKDNGLVDVLGGFEDAVRLAADAASVSNYSIRFYPQPKSFLERITEEVEQNVSTRSLKNELGELYPYYLRLKSIRQFEGVQARMPQELIIH